MKLITQFALTTILGICAYFVQPMTKTAPLHFVTEEIRQEARLTPLKTNGSDPDIGTIENYPIAGDYSGFNFFDLFQGQVSTDNTEYRFSFTKNGYVNENATIKFTKKDYTFGINNPDNSIYYNRRQKLIYLSDPSGELSYTTEFFVNFGGWVSTETKLKEEMYLFFLVIMRGGDITTPQLLEAVIYYRFNNDNPSFYLQDLNNFLEHLYPQSNYKVASMSLYPITAVRVAPSFNDLIFLGQDAFDDGYEQGYSFGFVKGKENGYKQGFEDGSQGQSTFANMFFAIFNAPFKVLNDAFNIEFFGINLSNLFKGLFSIALILFVISFLRNRNGGE